MGDSLAAVVSAAATAVAWPAVSAAATAGYSCCRCRPLGVRHPVGPNPCPPSLDPVSCPVGPGGVQEGGRAGPVARDMPLPQH